MLLGIMVNAKIRVDSVPNKEALNTLVQSKKPLKKLISISEIADSNTKNRITLVSHENSFGMIREKIELKINSSKKEKTNKTTTN